MTDSIEEKYILSTKHYEDYRNYLIVNSFFFDVLMKDLRAKLDLPLEGIPDIQKMIEWDAKKLSQIRDRITPNTRGKKSGVLIVKDLLGIEDATRQEAYAPIWQTLEKFNDLNLSFSLLHAFVLGSTSMSFSGSSRVSMVTSPADPIRETGVYIKYSPDLSEKEMIELMKQASDSYQTLFKITHKSKRTHDKSGKPFIKHEVLKVRQRKTDQPTEEQLKIYLAIENYLKENYSNRPDSIKMQAVFDEVADQLRINPDTLQRSYYVLVRNFQLPTSVDTKKIFKPITY